MYDSQIHAPKQTRQSSRKSGLNCKRLQDFDFLGQKVNLTFEREEVFTTGIGLAVSIFSIVIMSLFAYTRTVKLFNRDDPLFAMSIEPYDDTTIDLWALEFMFAVEDIDPRYGRL